MDGRIGNDFEALYSQPCCSINAAEVQRDGCFDSEMGFIPLKVALLMTVWRTHAALPPECRKFAPF